MIEFITGVLTGAFLLILFSSGSDAKKDDAISIMKDGLGTYKRIAETLERMEKNMKESKQ